MVCGNGWPPTHLFLAFQSYCGPSVHWLLGTPSQLIEFDIAFAGEHPGGCFGFDYRRAWHQVAVACSPELPAQDTDANYTGKYLQISQEQQR